jgi:GAF domain-containing protein
VTDDNRRLVEAANKLARSLSPGDLDGTLRSITGAAVRLLPQVDYASITILRDDGSLETKAATDDLLGPVDQHQLEAREGPCYYAARDQVYVVSTNLAADDRFPRYAPVAVAAGIRAQAGLRLFSGAKAQGALDLYSTNVGAFADLETLGELFTSQAGTAIGYAIEIDNLNEALQTRTMIGQAVGIVMERYHLTDERAFAFLTRLSQNRNVKLRLVAQEIIAASEHRGDDDAQPVLGTPAGG